MVRWLNSLQRRIQKDFIATSKCIVMEEKTFTKVITFRGLEWKQDVEVQDCIMCKYSIGCNSWGCVSPSCEITTECFGGKSIGSWCPFSDDIPKDKKFYFR